MSINIVEAWLQRWPKQYINPRVLFGCGDLPPPSAISCHQAIMIYDILGNDPTKIEIKEVINLGVHIMSEQPHLPACPTFDPHLGWHLQAVFKNTR